MIDNQDAIISMISSRDLRGLSRDLREYLSDDVEYCVVANRPEAPLWRQIKGAERVAEYLGVVPMMYEITERKVNSVVQDGALTVVMGHDLAKTYENPQSFRTDWTAILRIQSGKICRIQYVFQNWQYAA